MRLHPYDIVAYQGIDYHVDGLVEYVLADTVLRLARMTGADRVLFLEPPASEMTGRVLLMTEVDDLDLTTPPPRTIYRQGESYLLQVSGDARVAVTGEVAQRRHSTCALWRLRAAGGRYLQIERWPDGVRTLAGATVHQDMLEVRPVTLSTP